jgi:hypothetical protein
MRKKDRIQEYPKDFVKSKSASGLYINNYIKKMIMEKNNEN